MTALASGRLSPLASAMAAAAADLTAEEVTVAPETPSISAEPASRSWVFRVSKAAPPTAGVSLSPVSTTSVMAPSVKVRVTLTSPP